MNSLDQIEGATTTIKIGHETYTLTAPTLRIYADVIRKMRAERLKASNEAHDDLGTPDPVKRDYWRRVASTEITMEELQVAIQRPDMQAWVCWKLAQKKHKGVPLAIFENIGLEHMDQMVEAILYLFTIHHTGKEPKADKQRSDPPSPPSVIGNANSPSLSDSTVSPMTLSST